MIHILLTSLLAFAADSSMLEGKWRQDCKNGTLREEIFSGNFATLFEKGFEDSLCSSPSSEFINEGRFVLGNPLPQPNKASEIDFEFLKVSVLLHSANLALTYNQLGMCGIRNWKVGVPIEVTGLTCAFFGSRSVVPKAGEKRYGVYRLMKNYLFFGTLSSEFDARTPARRPREYNPYAFVKMD